MRLEDPFGQARGTSSAAWASDGHGFLNATTDALTSLTQLGARMYDASLGRFLCRGVQRRPRPWALAEFSMLGRAVPLPSKKINL
jgi:hypothetical protein